MNLLTKVFSNGIGTLVKQVGGVVDQFHLSGEEKNKFKLELESLLQKRDSEIEETLRTELQAKEKILVAELTQGDQYTKRARPTVVYAGLGFILFNYSLVPFVGRLIGTPVEPLVLPPEFWYGWSGIVATWSIGRSMEKRGANDRFTRAIHGGAHGRLLDEVDEARG